MKLEINTLYFVKNGMFVKIKQFSNVEEARKYLKDKASGDICSFKKWKDANLHLEYDTWEITQEPYTLFSEPRYVFVEKVNNV